MFIFIDFSKEFHKKAEHLERDMCWQKWKLYIIVGIVIAVIIAIIIVIIVMTTRSNDTSSDTST